MCKSVTRSTSTATMLVGSLLSRCPKMIILEGQENPPEYEDWPDDEPPDIDEPDLDISQEHTSIGRVLMMKSE